MRATMLSHSVFQWDFAPIPGKPDSARLWTLVLRCTAHIIPSTQKNIQLQKVPALPSPINTTTPPAAPSTFLPEETSPVPPGPLHLFSTLPLFSHYIYICYMWWLGSFAVLCFMKRRTQSYLVHYHKPVNPPALFRWAYSICFTPGDRPHHQLSIILVGVGMGGGRSTWKLNNTFVNTRKTASSVSTQFTHLCWIKCGAALWPHNHIVHSW